MYGVWLVDWTRWSCGTDIRLWEVKLVLAVALTLTLIVGGLVVGAVLVLDRSGRGSLSIVAAVLRLHMRGNTVHVRRRRQGLLAGEGDLGRARGRLDVEVELVVRVGKGLRCRGPGIDERVAEVDAWRRIHGQHEADGEM